jgi:glyoxylase-like metal-dependent hydrolase (beta-lactamase superfamily II)
VFDTHIHADHLSRSRLMAEATGAKLYLPALERVTFPLTAVHNNDVLTIGAAQIKALHTPGHTLESTSYLINNEALLTGHTLFLAAVGRPDLKADPEQSRRRAYLLYGSLQRLLALSHPVGCGAPPDSPPINGQGGLCRNLIGTHPGHAA